MKLSMMNEGLTDHMKRAVMRTLAGMIDRIPGTKFIPLFQDANLNDLILMAIELQYGPDEVEARYQEGIDRIAKSLEGDRAEFSRAFAYQAAQILAKAGKKTEARTLHNAAVNRYAPINPQFGEEAMRDLYKQALKKIGDGIKDKWEKKKAEAENQRQEYQRQYQKRPYDPGEQYRHFRH